MGRENCYGLSRCLLCIVGIDLPVQRDYDIWCALRGRITLGASICGFSSAV